MGRTHQIARRIGRAGFGFRKPCLQRADYGARGRLRRAAGRHRRPSAEQGRADEGARKAGSRHKKGRCVGASCGVAGARCHGGTKCAVASRGVSSYRRRYRPGNDEARRHRARRNPGGSCREAQTAGAFHRGRRGPRRSRTVHGARFCAGDCRDRVIMDKTTPHPLFKLSTELGPLLVFFVANAKFNLFVATGAFMVAIVAAMIASYVVVRHIPVMAVVTGVIVIVFGTLTLLLHDETFIKIKPTIIYGLFAAILGGGLLFGRSFIAIMFDQMFNLTPQGWRILTMRWALFFMGMAILNEIVWRTQSTDFMVAFKALVVIPLTMVFAISQMRLTRRYHLEPASLETSEAEAGDVSQG